MLQCLKQQWDNGVEQQWKVNRSVSLFFRRGKKISRIFIDQFQCLAKKNFPTRKTAYVIRDLSNRDVWEWGVSPYSEWQRGKESKKINTDKKCKSSPNILKR